MAKIKVYTIYNRPKIKVSKSGTGIEPIYKFIEDEKTGEIKRVKTGETNVYQFIQQNAKLCGLDLLIAQIKSGDFSGLVKSGGLYADEKDLPKTIHEAKEKSDKMIQKWSSNPILRKLYKTPDEYIDDLFAGKVVNKVNDFYRDEVAKSKKTAEDALKPVKDDKVTPEVKPEIKTDKVNPTAEDNK